MSSFRGKRKDEDYASDDNAEAHAPRKKISKAQSSDDSDDVVVCEISKNRRVSVRNWQGKVWVDIREFYIKDGKQYPGKKVECTSESCRGNRQGSCIVFLERWSCDALYNILNEVGAYKIFVVFGCWELKWKLGGCIYVIYGIIA
ncbi:RNA polymerase II transcriptional coactivator KIWI isoform X2 [Tripterygium wilfordii]|uniref:RNA polymerase II transcriptional coactivator KIWI isoform X2 n=1 Tax=Tripterygium wilfordii TaxID=458696 RepID=UPI0018F80E41|nr:RNA polymerase II transcriptional coactivator KIWI isoform X2 [Tripterygium wilfordii]